jgi:hypothetical protein
MTLHACMQMHEKIIHFKQKPCLLFIVGFHYVIMEEPSRHVKAMNNVRVGPPPNGILNENIISFEVKFSQNIYRNLQKATRIKATKTSCTRHGHICRSPRKQIIYILSKVKLLRYHARGTGISS